MSPASRSSGGNVFVRNRWLDQCERLREKGRLPLAQGNRDLWPMGNMAAELVAQSLGPDEVSKLYQPETPVTAQDLEGLNALVRLRDARCFELEGVVGPGGIGAIGDDEAGTIIQGKLTAAHITSLLMTRSDIPTITKF